MIKVYAALVIILLTIGPAYTQSEILTYSSIYVDDELDKSVSSVQPFLIYGSDTITLVDGKALGIPDTQETRKRCLTLFYRGDKFSFGKVRPIFFEDRVDFHLFTPKSEEYSKNYGKWPGGNVRFVYFYTTTVNLSLEEIAKGASEGVLYSVLESKHKKLKKR